MGIVAIDAFPWILRPKDWTLTCTVWGSAECRCWSVALFLDYLVAGVRKSIVDSAGVDGTRGRNALAEILIRAMSTGGSAGIHDAATMQGRVWLNCEC